MKKLTEAKMTKTIGNVTVTYLKKHRGATYSDGAIEDELLSLFSSKDSEKKRTDILDNNPSWPLYYHLSPQRGVLIDWVKFRKNATVLEIGAGCGAITETLVKKDVEVTALELSERRALVNAHRNSTAENLSIIIGNLEQLKAEQKFDYIVCVGVLEYAGTFIDSDTPYETFVQMLKAHLKDDGTLILAIENRLGLKYWAGAREDHTGGFFDSLNHYPQPKKVQTFGRQELKDLLMVSGLPETTFYFPFPDYKHPTMVFSEVFAPSRTRFNFPLSALPAPAFDQSRTSLFSEGFAMQSIEANNLFPDFSNSFLVFASVQKKSSKQPLFYRSNRDRKQEFLIETTVESNAVVQKRALTSGGDSHVTAMGAHYDTLSSIFGDGSIVSPVSGTVKSGSVVFPFVGGVTLDRHILDQIIRGDTNAVLATIRHFIQLVKTLPEAPSSNDYKTVFGNVVWPESTTYVTPALIDSNFDNIIIDESGQWHLIDYEWVFNFPIPVDFLIARTLIYFFQGYAEMLRYHGNTINLVELVGGTFTPDYIHQAFKQYFEVAPLVLEMESNFQKYVLGKKLQFKSVMREAPEPVYPNPSPVEEYLAIPNMHQKIGHLEQSLAKSQADFTALESAHNAFRYRWKRRLLFGPKIGLRVARKAKRGYRKYRGEDKS